MVIAFVVFLFFPGVLHGFPENVRHGYANCITCHLSPNGGGILTPYGRSLSRELVSFLGTEGESDFAYGVIKPPEWLNVGGDVRAVQTYLDTPTFREGRFILMQADLEAAVIQDRWCAVATIGHPYRTSYSSLSDHLISRRHYVKYSPTDKYSIRAGKFSAAYGLLTPDHILEIKRTLDFDQGMESYNLEGAYLGDDYDLFVTAILGRIDSPSLERDKGFALRGSKFFLERYKLGVSYYYGRSGVRERHLLGPYGIIGISKHLFILTEIDFQNFRSLSPGRSQNGVVSYLRLHYEVVQGIHGFLTYELSKLDFGDDRTRRVTYGIGAQIFPRPHLEIMATYQKQSLPIYSGLIDYAWILFHYYL